jgi:hypothetical protein
MDIENKVCFELASFSRPSIDKILISNKYDSWIVFYGDSIMGPVNIENSVQLTMKKKRAASGLPIGWNTVAYNGSRQATHVLRFPKKYKIVHITLSGLALADEIPVEVERFLNDHEIMPEKVQYVFLSVGINTLRYGKPQPPLPLRKKTSYLIFIIYLIRYYFLSIFHFHNFSSIFYFLFSFYYYFIYCYFI